MQISAFVLIRQLKRALLVHDVNMSTYVLAALQQLMQEKN